MSMRDLVSISAVIFECCIALLYFTSIFNKKYSRVKTILGSIGLYLVPLLAFVLINNSYLNALLFFFTNCFCAILLFETSVIKSIVTSIIFTALMGGSEFISIIFLSLFSHSDVSSTVSALPSFILVVTISKTLLLLLSIFVAKIVFGHKFSGTERYPAFLFIFPVSAVFIDFSFWSVCENITASYDLKIMVSIGSVVLLLSILLTYVFYGSALRRSQELFQLQKEYEKVQVDKEYYDILDHQNEELRTFIHDEKNHLTALQSMSSTEEIQTYITGILGELQYSSPVGNTKNKMLDLILGKYTSLCAIRKIKFTYSTITANLSFIEDTDLVSLLSNILDNAIEAAESTENGWVELSVHSKVSGMTILICENSSNHSPVSLNGNLVSSKSNKKYHGIGIKSIVRTAKKYGGNYEWNWDATRSVFTSKIVFEH